MQTGLDEVRRRMDAAARAAARDPADVHLIAVSKVQPEARVRAVLDQGHRLFGENRVQEAAGKWPALASHYAGVSVHLIGPLQTNKVRQALGLFDAIHSLDRDKLALSIAREVQARGACPDLFVQVNTGAEPQKAGVLPQEADDFIRACRQAYELPICGLMVIPPANEDPAPHFALLRDIAERNGLPGLSMGMSGDFEAAIALGATHVRVGSAIFGERVPGQDAPRPA